LKRRSRRRVYFQKVEMDEETGLYYYGARYLDPKYSRWLSGDPALSDYIPKAPIDDEAKKHNENLPGMGGVFNVVNLHLYHYAGNNPIKYEDPDGKKQVHPGIQALDRHFETVQKNNTFVENLLSFINDDILTKGNAVAQAIDTIFHNGEKAKEARTKQLNLIAQFESIKLETKSQMLNSGGIAPNSQGKYSMKDAKKFAESVNDTMVFNYSDKLISFPYTLDLPLLTESDAYRYLNSILPNPKPDAMK